MSSPEKYVCFSTKELFDDGASRFIACPLRQFIEHYTGQVDHTALFKGNFNYTKEGATAYLEAHNYDYMCIEGADYGSIAAVNRLCMEEAERQNLEQQNIIKELRCQVARQQMIVDSLSAENTMLKKKLTDVMNEVP